jgi:predicted phosphoribosyltransferase
VIVVDDGMATGSSMRAALAAVRQRHPAQVVVAVPAGAPQTCAELQGEADVVICAITPTPFVAVGMWYSDFRATTDDEVREALAAATSVPSEQRDGNEEGGRQPSG